MRCKKEEVIDIKMAMFRDSQLKRAKFEEAEKLGHVYYLFVEGHAHWGYDSEWGWDIIAETEEKAIKKAHEDASTICKIDIDNIPIPPIDDDEKLHAYMNYGVTHPFKLIHQGRIIYEYTPVKNVDEHENVSEA
jgi:hypothetical protein